MTVRCTLLSLLLVPGAVFGQTPTDDANPTNSSVVVAPPVVQVVLPSEVQRELAEGREATTLLLDRVRALEEELDRQRQKDAALEEAETKVPLDLSTVVRGFADVAFDLHHPAGFRLGDLQLSFRANLDKWLRFRGDVRFFPEIDGDTLPLDVEQLNVDIRVGEYGSLVVGRFPQPASYWASENAHSAYLFIPATRPHISIDAHGPFATHQLGVRWQQRLPIGLWQAEYAAWWGSGDAGLIYGSQLNADAGGARIGIESPGGLRLMVSGYVDHHKAAVDDHAGEEDPMDPMDPVDPEEHDEEVGGHTTSGHASVPGTAVVGGVNMVYEGAKLWLQGEFYLIGNIPLPGEERLPITPHGYGLVGYKVDRVTPYLLFDYARPGLGSTPQIINAVGVRFDFALRAALKVEFNYLVHDEGEGALEQTPSGIAQLAVGF